MGGGVNLLSPFPFIFAYVIDLSLLVSKSAYLPPNLRWFRFYGHMKVFTVGAKIEVKRVKNQGFHQDFNKDP